MGNTVAMNTVKTNSELLDWQSLFNHIPASILVFDKNMRCIRTNNSSDLNFTSKSSSFMMGRSISDLLLPVEMKTYILEQFISCTSTEKMVDFNIEIKDDQNVTQIVSVSIQPIFDDKTKKISSYMTISKTDEIAKSISEVKKHDWELFSKMNDFVIVVDHKGIIEYINRSFLGTPESEMLGTDIKDYFEGDESMIIKAALHRVFSDGTSLCFENFLNVTGTPRWFSNTINPVSTGDEIISAIFICREISGMKSSINELQEINKRGNSIVDSIDEGVMIVDSAGSILIMNAVAQNMFGRSYRNLIEIEEDRELRLESAQNSCEYRSIVEPILLVLSGKEVEYKDCLLYSPNHLEGIVLNQKISPINEYNGVVDGVVVILKDMTASHRANEKLYQSYKTLDDFVQATAHDLKSPVSNIRNLFYLMDKVDDPEKKEVFVEKVKKSVDKLDDLLEALMEMADTQGNGEGSIEKLSFSDTFNFIKEELQPSIKESNATIKCDFSKAENIIFKKAFLRSIIMNLLTNAIKYRSDDRELEIKISTSVLGRSILLEVEDNGMGIDLKRYKNDLFKPFRRLTTKGEGKGIGLNLVKSFVEKNGGDIMVESKKEVGTKFLIYLKPYDQKISTTN